MAIKAVEWARHQLGRSWEETDAKTGEVRVRELGPRHILALVEIADCINKRAQFAFPGPERMARATGLGERQQRRLMRDLEAAGCMKQVLGAGKGRGRGREVNRYYLACDPATGAGRPLPIEALTRGQKSPVVTALQADADDPYTRSPATGGPLYIPEPEMNQEARRDRAEREKIDAQAALSALGVKVRAPARQLCPQDRDARIAELRRAAEAEAASLGQGRDPAT